MGLDISFYVKAKDGFEEIATYRNTWELLNWIKMHKFDEREEIQTDTEPVFMLTIEDIENLVERAEYVIEKNHRDRNNRFSDDFCPLVRSSCEEMDEWTNDELDEYLNDVQDYRDTFITLDEDVYFNFSY